MRKLFKEKGEMESIPISTNMSKHFGQIRVDKIEKGTSQAAIIVDGNVLLRSECSEHTL